MQLPVFHHLTSSKLNRGGCVLLAIVGFLAGQCALHAQRQTSAAATESVGDRSCSMPGLAPKSHQSIQGEDMFSAYTAQASRVKSLEATVMARAKAGAEYKAQSEGSRPSPVMIEFHAPAYLRMTGVIPFSAQRVFDMSSDGRDFRLLIPDGKVMRFFVGPVDAPTTSSNPRENLRPQPVIDALHWPQGKLRDGIGKGQVSQRGIREITLDLAPSIHAIARTATVQFDLDHGVVTQLTIHDAAGRSVTQIQYGDWQEIARESGGTGLTCFPKRIVVVQPGQDLELEMKLMSVTLNPPISPQRFRLMPPGGASVTRLSPP
jgi:outer membrane lipoprotein-sorting protein